MSISEDKSEENDLSNSNNINNTEEPKNIPEQVSAVVEPSTEIGSKTYSYLQIKNYSWN